MVKQFFTLQARVAAAETRRQRAALKAEMKDMLQVFVVMAPQPSFYGWEIRQFGGMVIDSSTASFTTLAEARRAGEVALASGSQALP